MRTYNDFIEWLREYGILNQFYYNFSVYAGESRVSVLRLFSYNQRHTILNAFDWDETPEGLTFWSEIDSKFIQWYDNLNI